MNPAALIVAAWLSLATQPAAQPADPAKPTRPGTPASPAPAETARAEGPFDKQLLAIAADYTRWPRVSDKANWAPAMCRIPAPTGVQRSVSGDAETHGKKLYFVFARDSAAYTEMSSYGTHDYPGTSKPESKPCSNPVGQSLVKQSFAPVPVKAADVPKPAPDNSAVVQRELPEDYARDEKGDIFKAGEARELFIMTKVDPKTEGTDQGWVYAVLSADGKKVISAGAIESCMECHKQTNRDRLYGSPWSWPRGKDGKVDWSLVRERQPEAEKKIEPASGMGEIK